MHKHTKRAHKIYVQIILVHLHPHQQGDIYVDGVTNSYVWHHKQVHLSSLMQDVLTSMFMQIVTSSCNVGS